MDLDFGYTITLNGAQIIPNKEQHEKLTAAISQIIFAQKPTGLKDLEEELGMPRVKRRYNKRSKMPRYSAEEDTLITNRRFEGVRWKKIAHEISVIFGVKRSTGALYQRWQVLRAKEPVDVADAVLPTDERTVLRANEWGGTDGVKAHNLA